MNRSFWERVLGAAILLAVGVLLIPMLLGEPVPRPPPRPEKLLPEQLLPDLDLEIPAVEVARPGEALQQEREGGLLGMQSAPPGVAAPTPPPALAGQTTWSVQVSSFRERAPAEKLRDKLRRAAYPAFIRDVDRGGVSWYQVKVGAETHRDGAERLRQRLRQVFALEGLVTREP